MTQTTIERLKCFNENILPLLKDYEISNRFFEEGDFGSLYQIEFNSKSKGGNIDFWGLDWLGIFLWDYENEKELFNILIESKKEIEKENAFNQLIKLI